MAEYRLIAIWRIAAPLQQVFDAIFNSLQWPVWWPGADGVEQREDGDSNGIGSVRHYVWKGRLPYRLRFDACATRIEPLQALEATVSGDLQGFGRWIFSHRSGITTVHYEWHVHTTKLWMNLVAPAVRAVFANNHNALMRQGAEALALRLNATLIEATCRELPTAASSGRLLRIDWSAAMMAGIIAGIVATLVQMGLWRAASYSPTDMLLRDSRLVAAIVMGRPVLPPPASFDWIIMLAATLVHFTLSLAYGVLQAVFVARLNVVPSILAGCLFGLFLFGVNMYGFTAFFPWFEASRDWITAATHVSFGVTAAGAYKLWENYISAFRQQINKPEKRSRKTCVR